MDFRHACRLLVRQPGFTAVALLSLALGIGANTAIFTIVNAVLLRPLPYPDAARLVVLGQGGTDTVPPANFLDWRAANRVFEAMGAAEYWTPNLSAGGAPEEVNGLRLTADVLPLVGVPPMLGRVFRAGEDHVAVIAFPLWKNRFGADAAIVGKTVALNGEPFTVVGVMPERFVFAPFWATKAQIWAPLDLDARRADRAGASLRIFARLNAASDVDRARGEMTAIAADLERRFPGTNRRITVTPLHERVVGRVRPALLALVGAVGLVLLIACANLAHLQLVRASGRARELAVRAALGASRGRLARQLAAESVVLSAAGGLLGAGVAWAGVRLLVAFAPPDLPRLDGAGVDGAAIACLAAATLAAGVLFGLAPAWRATRANPNEALKDGGRGVSDGGRRGRVRSALVASEFAMALVLLVAAALLLRSFAGLLAVDAGFDARQLLTMRVSLTGSTEAEPSRRAAFFDALLGRVRALPGVSAAGITNHLPLHGDAWIFRFAIEGRPIDWPAGAPAALYRVALPGYFEAMRIPIVRGRDVSAGDVETAPHVVVVNETLARRHFGQADPVGQRLAIGDPAKQPDWCTIVGVVRDTRQTAWAEPAREELYFPYRQTALVTSTRGGVAMTLVVRSAAGGGAAAMVREAVSALNPAVAVSDVIAMDAVVGDQFAAPRFYVWLLAGFGAVAALLAAIGVYGVMSHAVARRSQEIGIRIALGATAGDVVRLVAGQGLRLAALGGIAGLLAAVAATRYLRTLLFGVGPLDPVAFVAAPFVLAAVAVAACYVPARRALRVDPVVALRGD